MIQEIPFTNDIGQVIQPGDSIIAVASGYNHSVKIRRGVYVGCTLQKDGKVSSVQVISEFKVFGRWLPNGEMASYNYYGDEVSGYEYRPKKKKTTLPRKRIYAIV